MYECPECGQPTKFRDLCNDCVDKFMKELDEDLKDMEYPMWMYNLSMLIFRRRKRRKNNAQ